MRLTSSSLFRYLIEAVAGMLALGLLSGPAAVAGTVKPSNDFTHLPRSCATPQEKVPQQPLICYLTPFEAGRPTVFLWGDSHAWMQIPALRRAAKGKDVNLVTSIFGSCPAMIPGLTKSNPNRYGRCGLNADLAYRFVKTMRRRSQPLKVILAGNWEMYERAIRLMDQGKGPKGGHGNFAFAQARIFRKGGPKLARKLAEWRIDVDIVGQVARPPRRTGPCAAGTDPYRCAFPRRKAFLNERATINWLGEIFAPVARQGIRYLDLNEHLCSPYLCLGRVDGVNTYYDNSHITASMSRRLASFFRPSVEDVAPAAPAPGGGGGGDGGAGGGGSTPGGCELVIFC